MEIGPSVFIGARGKVGPRNESYTWIPKSVDFAKLQEVEVFSPTQFNSCLRAVQIDGVFGSGMAVHFSPKNLGLNARFLRLFLNSSGPDFQIVFG